MKYVNKSFTMPTCSANISTLQYDLAVGKITQEEYDNQIGTSRYWYDRFLAETKAAKHYGAYNAAKEDGYDAKVNWRSLCDNQDASSATS